MRLKSNRMFCLYDGNNNIFLPIYNRHTTFLKHEILLNKGSFILTDGRESSLNCEVNGVKVVSPSEGPCMCVVCRVVKRNKCIARWVLMHNLHYMTSASFITRGQTLRGKSISSKWGLTNCPRCPRSSCRCGTDSLNNLQEPFRSSTYNLRFTCHTHKAAGRGRSFIARGCECDMKAKEESCKDTALKDSRSEV